MQGIIGLCLAMAPAAESLLSSRFSTKVMLGQSTVGALQPLSRPPTTRRRSRSSFEGFLWSKTSGDEKSEANSRLSNNQPGFNTDASAVTATTAEGTALADATATSASMATSDPLASRDMPSNEDFMALAPTADEVAQYEQHWTFLLQAELSKSMSDVQVCCYIFQSLDTIRVNGSIEISSLQIIFAKELVVSSSVCVCIVLRP